MIAGPGIEVELENKIRIQASTAPTNGRAVKPDDLPAVLTTNNLLKTLALLLMTIYISRSCLFTRAKVTTFVIRGPQVIGKQLCGSGGRKTRCAMFFIPAEVNKAGAEVLTEVYCQMG